MEAARGVFAEMGYGAATVRDIIRATPLASGTFYNYFKSKEEIYQAIRDEAALAIRPQLREERQKAATVEEFISATFRTFFEVVTRDEMNFRSIRHNADVSRMRVDTPEVVAGFDELREDIEAGIAKGVFPADRCGLPDGRDRRGGVRDHGPHPAPREPRSESGGRFRDRPSARRHPCAPACGCRVQAGRRMKALVCREIADDIGTLRIEDIDLPPPGAGQARVRIRAAAVNFPDILTVQGKYQHKPTLPYVPGTEGAGDVIAVGDGVTNVRGGDRVIVGGLGCFAEEAQVAVTALRPIPSGADYATAAGFTAAYLTAYVGLVRRARIERGEWLLAHGAAGGRRFGRGGSWQGARRARDCDRIDGREAQLPQKLWCRSRAVVIRLSRRGEGAD
ncbi:MAG: TetR family transcriptional regulator [Rhizomicrobium sp.]